MPEVQFTINDLYAIIGQKEAIISQLNMRIDGITRQYAAAMARIVELERVNGNGVPPAA